jgi:hypothetical protein
MDTKSAYATFDAFDELSYTCIKYLMDHNELVWKLLKYATPNAWEMPDLTRQEKADLIFNGEGDMFAHRVFMDVGQDDVLTQETCIIRISPYSVYAQGRTLGTMYMCFEVYSHYSINHLSNYKTRVDMITKQFLQTFNGATVGGIGQLNLDQLANRNARAENSGQIPNRGKMILMGVKSA